MSNSALHAQLVRYQRRAPQCFVKMCARQFIAEISDPYQHVQFNAVVLPVDGADANLKVCEGEMAFYKTLTSMCFMYAKTSLSCIMTFLVPMRLSKQIC